MGNYETSKSRAYGLLGGRPGARHAMPQVYSVLLIALLIGAPGCASQSWFGGSRSNASTASQPVYGGSPGGNAPASSQPASYGGASPAGNTTGSYNAAGYGANAAGYASAQQPYAPQSGPAQASPTQPYYAAPQTYSPASGASASANSNQPYYYAAQPAPYTNTTRMVDPNVVPVGASGVGPSGADTMPPVGMGGPAPGAPYVGPAYPYGAPAAPNGPPGGMNGAPYVAPAGPNYVGAPNVPGANPGTGQAPGQPAPGQPAPGAAQPTPIVPANIVVPKDDDEGFDMSHLEPDYTWKEFKNLVGWGPDEKIARQAYVEGQALYRDKNYDEAAEKFYLASWRWPDSLLEEDAMFLEAESYFFADRYGKAQDAYSGLLKKHENTRYLDTAVSRLFAIATFWEQLDMEYHHWPLTPNATDKTRPIFDTYGNMLAAYRAVWLNDPTGPLADVAIWRVANSHFRRSEWEDAAYHYGLIRKNHPKSKYQKDAHLLELQARMRLYQGPRYSVSPLAEAETIANQTLKQFRGQLGDDEARVRQTKAQITELRAERDWMMAQYYDGKDDFGAAKYYYRDLLNKFPQTSFAEKTKQRMTEIQGLPDEPPKRFEWLTSMFDRDR